MNYLSVLAGCDLGNGDMTPVVSAVKLVLTIIQWVVPIILILLGTIDLVKAVTKGKDEEIKKEQKTLFTRVIAAVIVFIVPLVVSVVMGLIGEDDWKTCWNTTKAEISLGL